MADTPGQAIRARVEPALGSAVELVIGVWGDLVAAIPFDLYRLRTEPDAAQDFRDVGSKYLVSVAAHDVIDYDPGHTPDEGETMALKVEDFEYPELIAALLSGKDLPAFVPEEHDEVAFYCFRVRTSGASFGFLKHVSAVRLAKKSFIAAVLVGDRISRLEDEILTFTPSVDILLEANGLWITNASAFRSLFRGAGALATAVTAQVVKVSAAVPIANTGDFEEACRRDPRMMAKLARVAAQGYLPMLTPKVLRKLIKDSNLPADLLDADGKLVHDNSPQRRWMILRILDDAYVQSGATSLRYAANSKRKL